MERNAGEDKNKEGKRIIALPELQKTTGHRPRHKNNQRKAH
jgi:hypothetical protein